MALKVELKPNEKIIVGSCVITNTDQRAKLLEDRDQMLAEAAQQKLATVTDLADAAGLSRAQVHRIIKDRAAG